MPATRRILAQQLAQALIGAAGAAPAFPTPITCCTGASARPTRIEAAIIMPARFYLQHQQCAKAQHQRLQRGLDELGGSADDAGLLAGLCLQVQERACSLNQRSIRLGSMPMDSITSALRRLLVASWPDTIAMVLASASGRG
jgi:hypothetical protein